MDEGDHGASGLEAGEAARAEAEAAAEAGVGDEPADPTSPDPAAEQGSGLEASRPVQPLPILVDPVSSACPFLRLERDGVLRSPTPAVDRDHRCAALSVPVALSDAQQSLVCLADAHRDCPRYLHGTGTLPPVAPRPRPSVPRPTLAAAAILAASLVLTLAYTAGNGGLAVPLGTAVASASTALIPSPSAGSSPSPAVSVSPSAPASASPPASAAPSAAPPASPSPGESATPPPSAAPSPASDRYALLQPCPDRPSCYVYTVRAGDNLTSIGLFFGVPFDTILRLNPWIRDPTTIHKGDRIVLPPPTR